ncbi:hypothetical protein KKI95_18620 [Xenorhabdus bovienii]|uniref:hypothetical protein n=1 Tax=Xenorhabdus bovienii TaxID=40576 RepID=UPI000170B71F|nr:hypothetical protein [Xenorhabdus bovienii]MDE1497086.1 hypothetical protein [Xenorhabdus bovienii]MDE9437882.1 hypothetical protein [Xenorhabdus bovienii]MDE9447485.1 hypothetical protein [Xenorhabdus bovienii]MDE9475029.1 hypothetical protein [Xenorhabdus bovienii]MDE9483899.1 hypothetical protein [Xenorhabdus bovienii]
MAKLFTYQTSKNTYALARDAADLIKCAEYLCRQNDIRENMQHLHSCIYATMKKIRKVSRLLETYEVNEVIETRQ